MRRELVGRVVVDSGTVVVMDLLSSAPEDLSAIIEDAQQEMGAGMESEDRGVIINTTEDGIFPVYAEYGEDSQPERYVIEMYDYQEEDEHD